MYCPECRDEFRAGFTRCAGCDVDLVESLDAAPKAAAADPRLASRRDEIAPQMLDYCGFMDLDEARAARDRLREEGIVADILVREAPDAAIDRPVVEEYWLRVASHGFRRANEVLGPPAAEEVEQSSTECRECGLTVSAGESFCPACGESLR